MNENTKDYSKKISLDFLDRLTKVMQSSFKVVTTNVQDEFFEETLYVPILNEYTKWSLNVKDDSIFNIFVLLSAKPKKNGIELKDSYIYFKGNKELPQVEYEHITDYNTFLLQNTFNMIQFINISMYLYQRYILEERTKKEKRALLKLLIVSASNLYDELYSSRGKIEFAYYFKKLLENYKNPEKANEPKSLNASITPYNKNSWRREYASYSQQAKEEIDLFSQEEITTISNIKLICGKREDKRLPHLGERYVIEAGISNSEEDYNRIFIVTFL